MDTPCGRSISSETRALPGLLPVNSAKQCSVRLLGPESADAPFILACCLLPHPHPHLECSDACFFKQNFSLFTFGHHVFVSQWRLVQQVLGV